MITADYLSALQILDASMHRPTQNGLTRLWRFACLESMLPEKIGKGLYFCEEDALRLVDLLNDYALLHPRNLKQKEACADTQTSRRESMTKDSIHSTTKRRKPQ